MSNVIDPYKYQINILKVVIKYANIHLKYLANEFEKKYPDEPIVISIPNKRLNNIIKKATQELMNRLEWNLEKNDLAPILLHLSNWINGIKNSIELNIQGSDSIYQSAFYNFTGSKFHVCIDWELHICNLTEMVIKNIWNHYVIKQNK